MNGNVFLAHRIPGISKISLYRYDPLSAVFLNKLNSLHFNNNICVSGIFTLTYHLFSESVYVAVNSLLIAHNICVSLLFIKSFVICHDWFICQQFFFHILHNLHIPLFRYRLFSFTLPDINLDLLSRSTLIQRSLLAIHFFFFIAPVFISYFVFRRPKNIR